MRYNKIRGRDPCFDYDCRDIRIFSQKLGSHITWFYTDFLHNSSSLIKKLALRATNRGSILIEFAVCMPILIILLFYINDLVRLKRYHSQTEFVAQQMANILQNIAKKGTAEGRTISSSDIRYAASLAYLSIFPGKTNFHSGNIGVLGYNGLGYVFCVQGNEDSTASVRWVRRFNFVETISKPSIVWIDQKFLTASNIKILTNAAPSEIYPTLKINPGDIKIIIECSIFQAYTSLPTYKVFGLYLYKIPRFTKSRAGGSSTTYFHSAVIFSPTSKTFFQTAPS